MSSQGGLIARYTSDLPPGRVEWIGLREERKGEIRVVDQVCALEGQGLEGDRRCQGRPGSGRQVTFISREFIAQISLYLGRDAIDPVILRRNILVSGINLNALRHQRFAIGEAEFEATAWCHPCARMESVLGPGGFAAMLGHGGLCARISKTGILRVGDALIRL
ncbi:MOSC domain-containing protein [Motiliproteus sediminis]|uniref:MOSC domain-containing protein n=1 Tax=Motiliproteus sediminis TaxID=1468178 RepID=UPI001AEFBAB0|nr:MOSC domain-containing protein [Motiliproteus sediminis]